MGGSYAASANAVPGVRSVVLEDNRLAKVESEIAQFEARSKELHALLTEDPAGDWEKLNVLANEEQELRSRLERRYAEWERLTETLEGED